VNKIDACIIRRQYDASGTTIEVLMKGVWDGTVFVGLDRKGLETRVYNPKWVYILVPLTDLPVDHLSESAFERLKNYQKLFE